MSDILYEKDMYVPLKEYFTKHGFDVRAEVEHCDLCAIKNEEIVVVEMKKNLTVELLVQGVKRQKVADFVYVAIPKPKKFTANSKWKDITHLMRRLEMGLIFVSVNGSKTFIEIPIHPEQFDRNKSNQRNKGKKTKLIDEFKGRAKDLNVGGSNKVKLMTAYKENSLYVACCLEYLGASSATLLKKWGTDDKKTYSILYDNHYGWFYKVDKGVYDLTDKGREGIKEHSDLCELLKSQIASKSKV